MKVAFLVNLDIDTELLALDARRWSKPLERVVAETLGDVECTLNDILRFKDGIASVGVRMLTEPAVTRQ